MVLLASFVILLASSVLATPALSYRGQSDACGIHGYDQGTKAYWYKSTAEWATYEKCSNACAKRSKCQSFAFGASACLLYKVSAASNVQPEADSPYVFYDMSCESLPPPQSSSKPSKTKSAKQPSGRPTRSGSPSSQSQAANCGVVGYDKGKPEAFYYSSKSSNSNLAACSARCKSKGCVSFAFGAGECFLYSALVAGNLDRDLSSPYTFYDASCVGSSLSSSRTVTVSSTSASRSSTSRSSTRSSSARSSSHSSSSSSSTNNESSSTSSSTILPSSTSSASSFSSSTGGSSTTSTSIQSPSTSSFSTLSTSISIETSSTGTSKSKSSSSASASHSTSESTSTRTLTSTRSSSSVITTSTSTSESSLSNTATSSSSGTASSKTSTLTSTASQSSTTLSTLSSSSELSLSSSTKSSSTLSSGSSSVSSTSRTLSTTTSSSYSETPSSVSSTVSTLSTSSASTYTVSSSTTTSSSAQTSSSVYTTSRSTASSTRSETSTSTLSSTQPTSSTTISSVSTTSSVSEHSTIGSSSTTSISQSSTTSSIATVSSSSFRTTSSVSESHTSSSTFATLTSSTSIASSTASTFSSSSLKSSSSIEPSKSSVATSTSSTSSSTLYSLSTSSAVSTSSSGLPTSSSIIPTSSVPTATSSRIRSSCSASVASASAKPGNLLTTHFPGYFSDFSVTTELAVEYGDDCPGYNNLPTGFISFFGTPQSSQILDMVISGLPYQENVLYNFTAMLKMDTSQNCRFAVRSSLGGIMSIGHGPLTYETIPTDAWTRVWASFFAPPGDKFEIYSVCIDQDATTFHVSDMYLASVSSTVYTENNPASIGSDLVTNGDFDDGTNDYTISTSSGVSYTTESSCGQDGSACLTVISGSSVNSPRVFNIATFLLLEKGKVYSFSFDFYMGFQRPTGICTLRVWVSMVSAGLDSYELREVDLGTLTSGWHHFSHIYAAALSPIEFAVRIACEGSNIPANSYKFDKWSVFRKS